jgi:hypothetical protein
MTSEEIQKELWSLANIITGFSVAQSLAFAVALGKDLASLQTQTQPVKITLGIFCLLFGVAYSLGVQRCHQLAKLVKPFEQSHEVVWRQVTWGRMACIWLFTIVAVFGLFAPNFFSGQTSTMSGKL